MGAFPDERLSNCPGCGEPVRGVGLVDYGHDPRLIRPAPGGDLPQDPRDKGGRHRPAAPRKRSRGVNPVDPVGTQGAPDY